MDIKSKLFACRFIFIFGIVNFLAYCLMAAHLGGDAINGKMAAGHFYLANHGRYTEVSEAVFNYSRWHTYGVWVTHPLAFIAVYFSIRIKNENQKKVDAGGAKHGYGNENA